MTKRLRAALAARRARLRQRGPGLLANPIVSPAASAVQDPRRAPLRQRAFGLLEGILYIGLMGGFVVFMAGMIREETRRQEETIIAQVTLNAMLAAQKFVKDEEEQLRIDLLEAAEFGGRAIMSVRFDRLVSEGYLPSNYIRPGNDTLINILGQRYTILIRAVERSDNIVPQSTLTLAQMDSDNNGSLDGALWDSDPNNGHLDIEAILTAIDGNPAVIAIQPNRAGRILAKSGRQTAGYVRNAGRTEGNYGNFNMDITPFAGLTGYPESGDIASIISLSGFGVITGDGDIGVVDLDMSKALLRCADTDAASNPIAWDTCIQNSNNEMYSGITFETYQAGGVTQYPGIAGLTNLRCGDTTFTTGNYAPLDDFFIVDCQRTDFTGNVVLDGDHALVVGDYTGVLAATTTQPAFVGMKGQPDNLATPLVNEALDPQLAMDEDIILTSVADLDGIDVLDPTDGTEARLSSDRILLQTNDPSQPVIDFGTISISNQVVNTQSTIAKPVCPIGVTSPVVYDDPTTTLVDESAPDVTVQLVPRIYVTPAGYADARGRAVVGVRAFATDPNPADMSQPWTVRMISFVAEDYCTAISGGTLFPLDPTGPTYANGAPIHANCVQFQQLDADPELETVKAPSDPTFETDGRVDVYEVIANFGKVSVQTRCEVP